MLNQLLRLTIDQTVVRLPRVLGAPVESFAVFFDVLH
jgi:hypothetical protein